MKKVSARQSVVTALIGVLITLFGAIIQFLMIYWILNSYGTEFNGFVRIATSLSVLGGSAEGALGITTVIMLMKPITNNDWIGANEIYSTARKKYHKNIFTGTLLISLVAILYPMEIALAPKILNNEPIKWSLQTTLANGDISSVPLYELVGIIFIFGSKNIITSGFFGVYENILMADQKNMVRKVVVLLADTVVYGLLFWLLNLATTGEEPMQPIIPFLILLIYGPLRGFLIKIYVKKFYKWIKFYPDFNSHTLNTSQYNLWKAGIGQSILYNIDLLVFLVVLGASGLRTTSMLSLYLIIGINVRLIASTLVISFREYFIGIIAKEGRLFWDAYSKYELYTFIVAAFSFIFMSIIAPYLVTGLYGQVVAKDLDKIEIVTTFSVSSTSNNSANITVNAFNAQVNAFKFIFTSPEFSSIYAASTALIIMLQGQTTLIQAKRRFGDVASKINWLALVYLIVQISSCLAYARINESNEQYIKDVIRIFYYIKLVFMFIVYIYLWQYTWMKITYNSTFKYVLTNMLSLVLPISISVVINLVFISLKYPLDVSIIPGSISTPISISPVTVSQIVYMTIVIAILGGGGTLVLPIMLRPSVGLSLLLSLPIIKQIATKTKERSKLKRLQNENVNINDIVKNHQEEVIVSAVNGLRFDKNIIDQEEFYEKFESKEKPKIFKIKGIKTEKNKDI